MSDKCMISPEFYLCSKQPDIFGCLIYSSLKVGKSNNKKAVFRVTFVTFLELRVTSPCGQLRVTSL